MDMIIHIVMRLCTTASSMPIFKSRRSILNGSLLINAECPMCSGMCLVWDTSEFLFVRIHFCSCLNLRHRKSLMLYLNVCVRICRPISVCMCWCVCLSILHLLGGKVSVDQINRKLFDRYNPCFRFSHSLPISDTVHWQTRAYRVVHFYFRIFFLAPLFLAVYWFIYIFWSLFFLFTGFDLSF